MLTTLLYCSVLECKMEWEWTPVLSHPALPTSRKGETLVAMKEHLAVSAPDQTSTTTRAGAPPERLLEQHSVLLTHVCRRVDLRRTCPRM